MRTKAITAVFWASSKKVERGRLIRLERRQGEFILELKYGGHSYQVVARRKKDGTTYIGQWTWADKRKVIAGDVTFDFLTTEDGFLAFGKWRESGEYQWWFRLTKDGTASHLSRENINVHIGDDMDSFGWSTEVDRYLNN